MEVASISINYVVDAQSEVPQTPVVPFGFLPDLTRVKFGGARLPLGLGHSHIFIAWFGFC